MHSSDSALQPPEKNQKVCEEHLLGVEIDMISRLPDELLCHILSFVTPTKYSIRTGLISRRWENLWSLSPKLVLELDQRLLVYKKHEDLPKKKKHEDQTYEFKKLSANTFTNSVDNLLFLRDCLHIISFKLYFTSKVLPSRMHPSSWLCAIVVCNVRELDLTIESFSRNDFGELPWCLFTCKTLIVLKLSCRFILNVPYYVSLPNLKTLLLKNVIYLDDTSIQKLLSGCPLLEDLEIERNEWDQMRTVNIGLSSLKRLRLSSSILDDYIYDVGDDKDKIVVDAPNLEFIDLEDSWSDDIILKAFPNIIEAHVGIRYFEETNKDLFLSRLLQSMVNVRRLFLSCETLNLLWITRDPNLPTFNNLVHLELSYTPTDGPIQLMDFLRSSPILEALSLPMGIYCTPGAYQRDLDRKFRKNNPEKVPECLRRSLKTVEIQDFGSQKLELNIVKYLLENALVLEKITIFFRWPPTDRKFGKLQKKITNYPRLSMDCKLIFLQYREPFRFFFT